MTCHNLCWNVCFKHQTVLETLFRGHVRNHDLADLNWLQTCWPLFESLASDFMWIQLWLWKPLKIDSLDITSIWDNTGAFQNIWYYVYIYINCWSLVKLISLECPRILKNVCFRYTFKIIATPLTWNRIPYPFDEVLGYETMVPNWLIFLLPPPRVTCWNMLEPCLKKTGDDIHDSTLRWVWVP